MKRLSDEELHVLARQFALTLKDVDKKQLRFNDIVETAKEFYNDVSLGIKELVDSCDKTSPLYIKKSSMTETLRGQYGWMR